MRRVSKLDRHVFDRSMPPRKQAKAMEKSLVHSEKEMEVEADTSERRKMGTNAEMCRADPCHFEEICCHEHTEERGTE